MEKKAQKAIATSLIITSALAWIASIEQPDMMAAMTTYNPLSISLFTASWTAGMAAMMFPAITPMVALYNRFITSRDSGKVASSVTIQQEEPGKPPAIRVFRVTLFVGAYLLVWAVTGVGLLLGWSIGMNNTIMTQNNTNSQLLPIIYGLLLIVAGAYQFTPLKKVCIGYCESPMSFFMRRWKDGSSGAIKMGVWHGMYCLGCCWPYFLLMVALGWMNLLWMGLFAGVIFGEKMWKRGIWVARAAGAGLAVVGVLVMAGMLPSLVSSVSSMGDNDNVNGDMSIDMMDSNTGGTSSESEQVGNSNDGNGDGLANMQSQGQTIDSPAADDKMSDMEMSK